MKEVAYLLQAIPGVYKDRKTSCVLRWVSAVKLKQGVERVTSGGLLRSMALWFCDHVHPPRLNISHTFLPPSGQSTEVEALRDRMAVLLRYPLFRGPCCADTCSPLRVLFLAGDLCLSTQPLLPTHRQSLHLQQGCIVSFLLLWDFLFWVFSLWLFPTTVLSCMH